MEAWGNSPEDEQEVLDEGDHSGTREKVDGAKKIRGGELIGCGGHVRGREESSVRLWTSVHFGGDDIEFAFEPAHGDME